MSSNIRHNSNNVDKRVTHRLVRFPSPLRKTFTAVGKGDCSVDTVCSTHRHEWVLTVEERG